MKGSQLSALPVKLLEIKVIVIWSILLQITIAQEQKVSITITQKYVINYI